MARQYTKRNRGAAVRNNDAAKPPVGDANTNDGTGEQINGHDSIDPSTIGGTGGGSPGGTGSDGDDSQPRERRTRADAGKPRGSRKSAPLDLTDLKDILVLAHSAIAMAFSSPRIMIDDGEGEKLASAVQKVLRHYDLPDVASETKDWIGLVIVAGSIYGPRLASKWADDHTPPAPKSAQEEDNNVTLLTGMRQ